MTTRNENARWPERARSEEWDGGIEVVNVLTTKPSLSSIAAEGNESALPPKSAAVSMDGPTQSGPPTTDFGRQRATDLPQADQNAPPRYLRSKFNDAGHFFPTASGRRFIYRGRILPLGDDPRDYYTIDIYDRFGRVLFPDFTAVSAEIFHDGRSFDV
jgi:hypothetical protein